MDLAQPRRLPRLAEPEETGETFAENARLKALYYHHATGLPSVADDSGLEIDALGGLPGVHSAQVGRHRLRGQVPEDLRTAGCPDARGSTARFVCRLALADGGQIIFESEGVIEGVIADTPRGDKGFGYDPIFFYPPLGMTSAELDRDLKATVSHRGKAFSALARFLSSR